MRALREAQGLSQRALAERVKMERPNYARIEKGRVNVTVDTILRLCDGLDVKLTIVLGGTE